MRVPKDFTRRWLLIFRFQRHNKHHASIQSFFFWYGVNDFLGVIPVYKNEDSFQSFWIFHIFKAI